MAVLRAERIKDVRCNPVQWQLYESARAVLDANVGKLLLPQAEEALWVLDKTKMAATLEEARPRPPPPPPLLLLTTTLRERCTAYALHGKYCRRGG